LYGSIDQYLPPETPPQSANFSHPTETEVSFFPPPFFQSLRQAFSDGLQMDKPGKI
jgi:hypothetical protein